MRRKTTASIVARRNLRHRLGMFLSVSTHAAAVTSQRPSAMRCSISSFISGA